MQLTTLQVATSILRFHLQNGRTTTMKITRRLRFTQNHIIQQESEILSILSDFHDVGLLYKVISKDAVVMFKVHK